MGEQHFALFPSPDANFTLFFFFWESSRGIVAVVQDHVAPKVRVWGSLGSFCASPGGLQAAGVSHNDPRELKRALLGGSFPEREKWREKMERERETRAKRS